MIEDQLAPKRCGHTPGKAVVGREEAFDRIRAAVDAAEAVRAEGGDVLILARTDARHEHGLGEAMARAERFAALGADMLFVEAPRTAGEMREICESLPGPKMANIVEGGETPDLPLAELHAIGYRVAAYPLSLMAASMRAMTEVLAGLREDRREGLMPFDELRRRVGFDEYYATSERYASAARS
jgi:2-methylisocitrate lyase-like PEP mutase family enzyme